MTSRIPLPSKGSYETQTYIFDFTSRLAIGETIASQACLASVWTGDDANPSAILSGVATTSGAKVSQKVTGGVVGVVYDLDCRVETNAGQKLELAGYLAVVPEVV